MHDVVPPSSVLGIVIGTLSSNISRSPLVLILDNSVDLGYKSAPPLLTEEDPGYRE